MTINRRLNMIENQLMSQLKSNVNASDHLTIPYTADEIKHLFRCSIRDETFYKAEQTRIAALHEDDELMPLDEWAMWAEKEQHLPWKIRCTACTDEVKCQ